MRFAGCLAIYAEAQDDASPDDESTGSLPDIHLGRDPAPARLPARAALHPTTAAFLGGVVRELEEKGIGRPPTYTTILSTIQDRGYAEKKEGRRAKVEEGHGGTSLSFEPIREA